MAVRREFAEFLQRVKDSAADGRITLDEMHDVVREFADVVAPVFAALDKNNTAALDGLTREIEETLRDAIDALPEGRLGVKAMARAAVSYAVPSLVRQAAASGRPIQEWIRDNIVPQLAAIEQTAHSLRVALGG